MSITAVLLPVRCAGCGRCGSSPCGSCLAALAPAPVLPPPPGLDSLSALVRYDELSRSLITAVKYRNARGSVDVLADALAVLVPPAALAEGLVTWAPTTPARARERGFDQAELLARAVARRCGLPARRCLRRRAGPHQTGRGAAERLQGPRFAPSRACRGPVVVVDDVCTTGATLAAAASVLRGAGARGVHGLVLARTPARGARR